MDRAWWQHYALEVQREFAGERTSRARMPSRMQVTHLERMEHYNNSGAAAVSLAAERGAQTIVLLGYDCQQTNGLAHWHGNHPSTLGNAGSMKKWQPSFEKLADAMKKRGVRVLNATRQTALTCFERVDLETALATATPE